MNTLRKKVLIVSTLITITFMTSMTAQAGMFDWFISSNARAERASNGSFDSLYASIMSDGHPGSEQAAIMAGALVPANSPVGGVKKTVRKTYFVEVSGYSSEVAQTDDSPFITAKGTHVRDGIVAANMLPFGTVLKIPSLFGDKIFVVEDRMNTRYQKNVDVWFAEKADALKLGRRLVKIEVIM